MMKTIFLINLVLLGSPFCFAQQNSISKVWVADNGDGTYKNPIIHADYSDPDAIRVGDNYYMIASSFNASPGLPVLQSNDLVNWKIISHALPQQIPPGHFNTVQHGGGVWAPSIRYHKNEYYIYYPDPDFGIYLIKSKNIIGPWSEPVLVEAGKGLIDPCPLWDDNGKVYLVHAFAGSRAGIKSILVVKEMNASADKITGNAVMVYDGHEKDPTIEGPKFYKRNNYYYIFAPAGGVSTGWQTVLRSKNVYGPYERKVVLDQGATSINGPHQGAWVQTPTGEDWFIHFQDKDAYGRVVHLQPMKWVNDWPVIGADKDGDNKGEPVLQYKKPATSKKYPLSTPQDSDEFNDVRPGHQWQWQANAKSNWAFTTPNGMLRMFSVYQPDSILNLWAVPNIYCQKFPADEFTTTVKIKFLPKFENEKFGLVVFGNDYTGINVVKKNNGIDINVYEKLNAADGKEETITDKAENISGNNYFLRVVVSKGANCIFYFSTDGVNFTQLGKTFTAKPGKWVGAKMGLFCSRKNMTNDAGYADVDWIHFEK